MDSFGMGTLGSALGCSVAAVALGALLFAASKLGIFYQLFHKVGWPHQTSNTDVFFNSRVHGSSNMPPPPIKRCTAASTASCPPRPGAVTCAQVICAPCTLTNFVPSKWQRLSRYRGREWGCMKGHRQTTNTAKAAPSGCCETQIVWQVTFRKASIAWPLLIFPSSVFFVQVSDESVKQQKLCTSSQKQLFVVLSFRLPADRHNESSARWRERCRGAPCPWCQVRVHAGWWTHLPYIGCLWEAGHPHRGHPAWGDCRLRCWCCGQTVRCVFCISSFPVLCSIRSSHFKLCSPGVL